MGCEEEKYGDICVDYDVDWIDDLEDWQVVEDQVFECVVVDSCYNCKKQEVDDVYLFL